MAQIKPSEVSEILKKQIEGFKSEVELEEVGTVLQVGDGSARIYGLKTISIRQSCIYGYRQFGVEDQGWVAWFTIQAVSIVQDILVYFLRVI